MIMVDDHWLAHDSQIVWYCSLKFESGTHSLTPTKSMWLKSCHRAAKKQITRVINFTDWHHKRFLCHSIPGCLNFFYLRCFNGIWCIGSAGSWIAALLSPRPSTQASHNSQEFLCNTLDGRGLSFKKILQIWFLMMVRSFSEVSVQAKAEILYFVPGLRDVFRKWEKTRLHTTVQKSDAMQFNFLRENIPYVGYFVPIDSNNITRIISP